MTKTLLTQSLDKDCTEHRMDILKERGSRKTDRDKNTEKDKVKVRKG